MQKNDKQKDKTAGRVLARVLAEDLRNVEAGLEPDKHGDRPTTPYTSIHDTTV